MTFRDFLKGYTSAEVRCAMTGNLVRKLTVTGARVVVDCCPGTATADLDTPIVYEPWFMDRGSFKFECPEASHAVQLCAEFDRVRFDDGTEIAF